MSRKLYYGPGSKFAASRGTELCGGRNPDETTRTIRMFFLDIEQLIKTNKNIGLRRFSFTILKSERARIVGGLRPETETRSKKKKR